MRDAGGLVGVTVASRMLGILPPNFKRDAKPHLTPLEVDGSADVYLRADVERLVRRRPLNR